MSDNEIQGIVCKARVRIGQAAELLERSVPTAGTSPAHFLHAADSLWRELARRHEEDPERWRTQQVDGLRAEQVLARLNEVVYELLCAGI